MTRVHLRFLGCGDAFSSGGRLQTCLYLDGDDEPLLIDCGATALVGLKRDGIDPASIGRVALTHLHGDHFGGIPWLVIDGRAHNRRRPLTVAGPPGTEERVLRTMEALYAGSSTADPSFELRFIEAEADAPYALGRATVTPFEVIHPSGAPSYALRIDYGGKVIAYSGDTEWTDALIEAARGADLFVCESNFFDQKFPGHLDYRTLAEKRPGLQCGRLVLTHMGEEMLVRLDEVDIEAAADGAVIEV